MLQTWRSVAFPQPLQRLSCSSSWKLYPFSQPGSPPEPGGPCLQRPLEPNCYLPRGGVLVTFSGHSSKLRTEPWAPVLTQIPEPEGGSATQLHQSPSSQGPAMHTMTPLQSPPGLDEPRVQLRTSAHLQFDFPSLPFSSPCVHTQDPTTESARFWSVNESPLSSDSLGSSDWNWR